MQLLLMVLFVAGITAADQLTKLWVVGNIPLHGNVRAIEGVFHLTHVQNTGAAFSSFSGMRWLFLVLFAVLTVLLAWEYSQKKLPLTKLERWCIAAIYGGGLGNAIDRAVQGYVVDMIEVDFMRFAVFNVADCFVTCGCILLIVHLLFFNKEFWK